MTQKRIPTLVGLGVLIIGLIAGTLLFSQGTGVFSPRASAETSPKSIKITNVSDSSFTVSFITDAATPGFVSYGKTESDINSQASDDRDQLTGTVSNYSLHHITVRGLDQNTQYFFKIGTGSGTLFDNNNMPFSVTTAQRTGTPPTAKTIYGSVTNAAGAPAEGAVVYVSAPNSGQMSSLVKSSGSWAIPLSNARTPDGTTYASINDSDELTILVQGNSQAESATVTAAVANAQPVAPIALGSSTQTTDTRNEEASSSAELDNTPASSESAALTEGAREATEAAQRRESESESTASGQVRRGALADLLEQTLPTESELPVEPKNVVDLTSETPAEEIIVHTTRPVIKGSALPSVKVSIEVHSDTEIYQEVTAAEDGSFELDLNALSQDLEPGDHTVTYSYFDPNTGQIVEETVNFTVSDTSQQLAQAQTNTAGPYSTESPFPVSSQSPSPVPSPSVSPSPSPKASPSPSPATPSASPAVATPSSRSALPSTASGVPISGTTSTTLALIFGGLFFIGSGAWSLWISNQMETSR